jgi:YndJ-like protein
MDDNVDIRADARLRRHCRYSAFLGAGVWLAALPFLPKGEMGMIAAILLFVPLVLIRLGFAFLIPHGPVVHYRWWYVVSYSQLPAAIVLTVPFLLPGGVAPMLLVVPWLVFTLMLAGLAVDRIVRQPRPKIDEWGQLAAMLFPPIGAGWALLSRGDMQPLGFRQVIVLLTAIHFHYAGFAVPLMAGELVHYFRSRFSKRLLIAVLFGVPLTAVGITTTQLGGPREIELGAALLLAGCCVILGFGHLWAAARMHDRASGLLAIAGLSLIVALGWSALYAMGQYGLIAQIDIPFMVHWHGAINAVGAAMCGLFGWHLIVTRAKNSMSTQP